MKSLSDAIQKRKRQTAVTPTRSGYWRRLLIILCSLGWHFLFFYLLLLAYPRDATSSPPIHEFEISLIPGPGGEKSGKQAQTHQQQRQATPTNTAMSQSGHAKLPRPTTNKPQASSKEKATVIGVGNGASGKVLNRHQLAQLFTGGGAGIYQLRNRAGRRAGVRKYGGSAGSETAVAAGLEWLQRHQDADGKWDAIEFTRHCRQGKCRGIGFRKYNPALSALALMAFLGAGYSPARGRYRQLVCRTRGYLLQTQDHAGYFTPEMYNHAIVLLALVELYGQSQDWSLGQPIRQAIAASARAQQPAGGWTYEAMPMRSRNDLSITGWQIMALTAAKRLDFQVPDSVLLRAWELFVRFTMPGGQVRYADSGPQAFRQSDALAAVALLCGLISGHDAKTRSIQLQILRRNPPNWQTVKTLDHCMYYWYHGTLALFAIGGDDWRIWNDRLRPMLVARQVKAGEERGSWPPSGKWGSSGGRIYSTAINILNLEIYYRYHPAFLATKKNR